MSAADEVIPYDRALLVAVLVEHWRMSIGGCGCGWNTLGASFPEHVASTYEAHMRMKEQQ